MRFGQERLGCLEKCWITRGQAMETNITLLTKSLGKINPRPVCLVPRLQPNLTKLANIFEDLTVTPATTTSESTLTRSGLAVATSPGKRSRPSMHRTLASRLPADLQGPFSLPRAQHHWHPSQWKLWVVSTMFHCELPRVWELGTKKAHRDRCQKTLTTSF